jgi:putative ABC transport system permease protein
LPFSGSLTVFLLIAGSCSLVLRKLRKSSVVDAIRGADPPEASARRATRLYRASGKIIRSVNISLGARDVIRRLRSYKTPIIVFILCAFLIIVPINFLNTIQSKEFIGYTGVGLCDVIITLRYSGDIAERYAAVLETLAADKDVAAYAGRITANFRIMNPDGKYENISVQNGDFASFPIPYTQGRAPAADHEIALSLLNARDYVKSVGDTIEIIADGTPVMLTVSGIYQDLTNGGKSAQAYLAAKPEDILWYAVLLDLAEGAGVAAKMDGFSALFTPAKVTDINTYALQTLASTIRQLEDVTLAVLVVSLAVAILITALFTKMILAKDRRQIIIMKGLGFTSAHIQTQYVTSCVISLLTGLALGVAAANTLGELLAGALMSGLGAAKISFIADPLMSYAVCPALLLCAVIAATLLSTRSVYKYDNYIFTE